MERNILTRDKPNIAVITTPFYTILGQIFLANFIDLLQPLSGKIYVITGKFSYRSDPKIHILSIKKDDIRGSVLRRVLRELLAQPKVAFNLLKISKNVDIVIFFMGTRTYLLPLLMAKLLKKKTSMVVSGSELKMAKLQYGNNLLGLGKVYPTAVGILQRINYCLTDQMAVESRGTIDFQGLNKFNKKIAINGAMYVDTNLFVTKRELNDKANVVGYIGRLSLEKGVLNFVRAMPLILTEIKDIEFLVVGDGPLFNSIKEEIENSDFRNKVKLVGWVPHDKLPGYFGEVKLIVLPSYIEGLPGTIQEAMACGALVLATSVGAIPDLIKDEKTGFILENNSPECIARNVIRALEYPGLAEIVQNARGLIEKEYSYEAMVEKCQIALEELMKGKKS